MKKNADKDDDKILGMKSENFYVGIAILGLGVIGWAFVSSRQ